MEALSRTLDSLLSLISANDTVLVFGAGFLAIAVIGLVLMIRDYSGDSASHTTRRGLALGLLCATVGYAPINIVAFLTALSRDRFGIFEDGYMLSALLIGPVLMLLALLTFAAVFKLWSRTGMLGSAAWVFGVGLIHFWVIGIAGASV